MNGDQTSLLDQSVWWLLPYGVLLLAMLHAMMEFTASLLVRRPRTPRHPTTAAELKKRLLALNGSDRANELIEGEDCDLVLHRETADPPRRAGHFAVGGGGSLDRIRILLDDRRHEVRLHQFSRSHGFFFGLDGWLPRLSGFASFTAGPPGEATTNAISDVALRSGWSVRPVLWWFQSTHAGVRVLHTITPWPFRNWPARRFWAVLYPLTFALAMGYLAFVIGPLTPHNSRMLLGVSAGWWGTWGFLVWALKGFPAFWRRGQR